jgi:predicted negative regulator of RcsB-dependent stress response
MHRKKLLHRLKKFFDMDARDRAQRKDELNDLLSRLKQKESELKVELEAEQDESLKSVIAQKIDVVHTQRTKGIEMLMELRDENDRKHG